MKRLLLLTFLGLSFVQAHADILANGDFSEGVAHWKGNFRQGDMGGSLSPFSSDGGVILPLKDNWTYLAQTFHTRETKVKITIHYSTTPDYRPGMTSKGPQVMLFGVDGILRQISGLNVMAAETLSMEDWLVAVVDPSSKYVNYLIIKPVRGTNEQVFASPLPGIGAHEDTTLYLAFPPGSGSVNLISVSLESGQDDASSSANPLDH